MTERTKKLTTMAMLCAVAYVVMAVIHLALVPAAPFLTYDPKDIIITIGGFIYGPLASAIISLIVSLLEMVTISDSGPIGLVMNVLASCSFACTAAFIYKRKQTLAGAALGLLAGIAAMTGMMLLWNYFITPYYMGVPRQAVADMLLPVFLPFNLIKGGLNAAFIMLLYKPLVLALRKGHLVPPSKNTANGKINWVVLVVSGVVLVSLVLAVLIWQGVI